MDQNKKYCCELFNPEPKHGNDCKNCQKKIKKIFETHELTEIKYGCEVPYDKPVEEE